MVSVLILTLNEEDNLPRCLESLSWCDDVVVLDSFSTDQTVAIAEASGARVVQRQFDNWAAHQNWGLDNITFKHPWVYYSDADEVVTPELREELLQTAEKEGTDGAVAFRLRYKNYFWGKWIKHCGIYPTWVMRFFRPEKIRWERLVNPRPVVDGKEGNLDSHFEHYSFNKGLTAWFDKHNKYSQQEAEETLKAIASGHDGEVKLRGVFSRDAAVRRRTLKELSFHTPCRALLRFVYMYFFKLGFLDGRAGLRYCLMLMIYEYMIEIKVAEIRRVERGLTI